MTALQELGPMANVPVYVEVELDRMPISMDQILKLETGSVLRMSRSAGENIDIRVAGTLLGTGEIVVIEEKIGVRITDFATEE